MDGLMVKVMGAQDLNLPPPKSLYPPEKQHSRMRICCTNCMSSSADWIVQSVISLRAFALMMGALLGPFAFYASYNILLSPAVRTLHARLRPTTCVVAKALRFRGMSNCNWSSCKVGCTDQELYVCSEIYVMIDDEVQKVLGQALHDENKIENITDSKYDNYFLPGFNETVLKKSNLDLDTVNPEDEYLNEITTMLQQYRNMTRLYINMDGCHYESCEHFWEEYGQEGYSFSCLVSRDKSIAITDVDYAEVAIQIVFGMAPLIGGISSIFLIYFIYCRANSKDKSLKLAPDPEKARKKWEAVQSQVVTKVLDQYKGKQKLEPKQIIDVMKGIRFEKKNKVSPEAFATAVLAVVDSENGLFGKGSELNFVGFKHMKIENPKNKGAKWRNFAVKVSNKVHPTMPPAKKFTEVEITKERY